MINIQLAYGIILVLIIALLIFWVFQTQKNRYSCTEDGCKITPFGKFPTLKSCNNTCNKHKDNVKKSKTISSLDNSNYNTKTETQKDSNQKTNNQISHSPGSHNQISHSPGSHNQISHTPGSHTPSETNKLSNGNLNHNDKSSKVNIVDKINKNNINPLYINYNNVKNIHDQIQKKKQSNPYFATTKQSKSVITDYDTFPYPRYFRGKAESSLPIVAEREAGWRPRHDDAYKSKIELELTPDCVMGSPSSNFLKLYKQEIYHCYDDNGNIISDYTCNPEDNCYDNDPSKCTSVGGIVGAPKIGVCTDSGALFNCPGGSANCFDDSTLYCPVQNIVQKSCPATSGQTFKCDSNDQYCVDDSQLYCPTN